MTDPPSNNPPSAEFRALSIFALAVAETLGQQGVGEKLLVNLMRVTEDQRSEAPKDDKAIAWADRLATELLIG